MLRRTPMLKPGKPQLYHLAVLDQTVMVAKAASDSETTRIEDFKVFDQADPSFESELVRNLVRYGRRGDQLGS